MTDRELNEAVTKKLGYNFKEDSVSGNHWHKDGFCYDLSDYCHSIEAAWEIVEKPELSWQIFRYANGSYSAAVFVGEAPNLKHFEAEADTAPMAICRAFLKLP